MPSKQKYLLGIEAKDSQRNRRQYNRNKISNKIVFPSSFFSVRTILTALFEQDLWKLDMHHAINSLDNKLEIKDAASPSQPACLCCGGELF